MHCVSLAPEPGRELQPTKKPRNRAFLGHIKARRQTSHYALPLGKRWRCSACLGVFPARSPAR
eukprot:1181956-Heterocapsa_arctica.AAC.1